MKQINVPIQHRSKSVARLRDLAENSFQIGSKERKLLLDVVAEIEGGEQAYADLVDVNRVLREKIQRYEKNLD